MNWSNKSFFDILSDIANSSEVGIFVAVFIFSFAFGILVTSLYFSKFKYIDINNQLADLKRDNIALQQENENILKKNQELTAQCKRLEKYKKNEYIDLATKADNMSKSLKNQIFDENSDQNQPNKD